MKMIGSGLSNTSDEDSSHAPNQAASGTLHLDDAEERMRRALGLIGGNQPQQDSTRPPAPRPSPPSQTGRHKHRFDTGRDVAVTVVHRERHTDIADRRPNPASPVNRLEAAESALKAERAAREQAERSLMELQTKVRELQTKIVHADLAHQEALASAKANEASAKQALQELRDSLRDAEAARQAATSAAKRERAARAEAEEALRIEQSAREVAERKVERLARSLARAPAQNAKPVSKRAKMVVKRGVSPLRPKQAASPVRKKSPAAKIDRKSLIAKVARKPSPARKATAKPVSRASLPRSAVRPGVGKGRGRR